MGKIKPAIGTGFVGGGSYAFNVRHLSSIIIYTPNYYIWPARYDVL